MQSASVGIRDAKMHLSKYIKMVQQGAEVIITDRGRPVGKIIPIQTRELPLGERIQPLEDQGLIDPIAGKGLNKTPPPNSSTRWYCSKNAPGGSITKR